METKSNAEKEYKRIGRICRNNIEFSLSWFLSVAYEVRGLSEKST